jgi:hypothetical protein
MFGAALPPEVLGLEVNNRTTTLRASDAVRPAPRYEVIDAVLEIGEVYYSLLKSLGFACHESIMPKITGIVKYIITLRRTGRVFIGVGVGHPPVCFVWV